MPAHAPGRTSRRAATLAALVLALVLPLLSPPATAADPVRRDPTRPKVPAGRAAPVVGHLSRPLDPADPAAGDLRVGWELFPARRGAARGTVLAIEGGPGYATTASRDYYLELFGPLLRHRDLLLVDARGTGRSSAIDCPELQSYRGGHLRAVARCGRQLGPASDVFGSAFAADDLAAVLDHLGLDRVDVYGDSYGTFLGQTFAIRHPDRVRTLTLDAAYPVTGLNPWYPDLNRALRDSFRRVCGRDTRCHGDPVRRLSRAADALRRHPLRGRAYDADGTRRRVHVDLGELAYLTGVATYGRTVYQELDAAVRAWRQGDATPLLRIAAEQGYYGDAGPVRDYSEGAYVAVSCNDYPQLWDRSAPVATRREQLDAALARLRRDRPGVFAPFTVSDWVGSPWAEFTSCLRWPAPSTWVPPVPTPTTYPDLPVLVLVGDLDSITSPEGARVVAGRFPGARFVEVANVGHVTALADYSGCASVLVRRFVRSRDAGDTSCARTANPPVRMTPGFARSWRSVPAAPGTGPAPSRRAAATAVRTLGDVLPRWFAMVGTRGRGLRGGTFTTSGLVDVSFRLHRLRLVRDLAVSGTMRWHRRPGTVRAVVRLAGPVHGRLTVAWDDRTAVATASGRLDGQRVSVRMRAP
ncbi:MAG: alpha/beta fold hydrolase [Nocardioidaceae bacterium]